VSQEDVIALLDRASRDAGLRERLSRAASGDALEELVVPLGFNLRPQATDVLSDADLDEAGTGATDRTCFGTTDCCHTKRTCFGTTDCCH
jgi:hypothetical protein